MKCLTPVLADSPLLDLALTVLKRRHGRGEHNETRIEQDHQVSLGPLPFEIQGEQPREHVTVCKIWVPLVGRRHCLIKLAVRVS